MPTRSDHHGPGQLTALSAGQGTQGLGIMIFEGKHAEVGQGIFISDLQTGSPAEQVRPQPRRSHQPRRG